MLSQNAEWVQIAIMKLFHYRDEQCWINRNREAECFIEPSVEVLWQRALLCLQLQWLLGGPRWSYSFQWCTNKANKQQRSDESWSFGSHINHMAGRQGTSFYFIFFSLQIYIWNYKNTGHCVSGRKKKKNKKPTTTTTTTKKQENRPGPIAPRFFCASEDKQAGWER